MIEICQIYCIGKRKKANHSMLLNVSFILIQGCIEKYKKTYSERSPPHLPLYGRSLFKSLFSNLQVCFRVVIGEYGVAASFNF